jgi:hypothetical protein
VFVARDSLALPQQVKVAKEGETSLRAVLNGKKVQVTFRTVSLRKSDRGFPLAMNGYDQVSIVQDMSIFVDGKMVPVPWSAYADLYNVRGADVKYEKGIFKLVTGGGGGADTYCVHIYFNTKRVLRREAYNSFSPDKALEVIVYSPPVVIK